MYEQSNSNFETGRTYRTSLPSDIIFGYIWGPQESKMVLFPCTNKNKGAHPQGAPCNGISWGFGTSRGYPEISVCEVQKLSTEAQRVERVERVEQLASPWIRGTNRLATG